MNSQIHLARTGELPSYTDVERFRQAVLVYSYVVDNESGQGNSAPQAALDEVTTHIVKSRVKDKKVLEHHESKQFPND